MGGIAQLTSLETSRIRELNPNVDFDRLQAGSVIQLPSAAVRILANRIVEVPEEERPTVAAVLPRPEPAPDPRPEPEPAPSRPALSSVAAAPGASAVPATYRVEPGDNLTAIARRYGTSVRALQEENGLSGSVIVPGQELRIPGALEAEPTFVEHVVEVGETLSGIAARYASSVSLIQAENSITGSVIRPGQRLRVPSANQPAESVAVEPAFAEHTVASGETLTGIARRYGSTVVAIQEANSLQGSVIRPGQALRVPLESGNETGGSRAEAASVEHVVEQGETLWGIARRYDSSVEAISDANGLGSRPIVPGQRLSIPR